MLLAFDYDGVIVDSFDQLLALATRAQLEVGIGRPPVAIDLETIENLTFEALGLLIGIPEDKCCEYSQRIIELQKQQWKVAVYSGMVPVINELAKEYCLVVITASEGRVVSKSLNTLGVRTAFSRIYGGESGTGKAERIARARAELLFPEEDTFMIGDAVSDIRQGKAASVKTVAVSWGFQSKDLLQREGPDFLVDSPQELLQLLRVDPGLG